MKLAFSLNNSKSSTLTIAVIIALTVGALFLWRYFSLIVVAMIVAFIFAPVHEWLTKKVKSPGSAAALTLLITIVAILVPVGIVLFVTASQAKIIIDDVGDYIAQQNYQGSSQDLLNWVNDFLSDLTGRTVAISQEQVWHKLEDVAASVASFVLDTITMWIGGIGSIITNAILYMYIFTAVLIHQKKLISLYERLNPLGADISQLYLKRSGDMTKGMIRGQFIIAIAQGVTSALILSITGVPYFAFFALILSFLSVIPLGAGIVTIPIGIVRILMGDIWQGALILLGHFLIVTNIDNVLKPILVPKSVRLQPALTLLSVFAGMAIFGFLGIVIGPVIMILILTTIELYLNKVDSPRSTKQTAIPGKS